MKVVLVGFQTWNIPAPRSDLLSGPSASPHLCSRVPRLASPLPGLQPAEGQSPVSTTWLLPSQGSFCPLVSIILRLCASAELPSAAARPSECLALALVTAPGGARARVSGLCGVVLH